MTPAPYTEDTLVQQTTAEYLEQELGWESVFAYNNEDFGPDSLLGRESDREGGVDPHPAGQDRGTQPRSTSHGL